MNLTGFIINHADVVLACHAESDVKSPGYYAAEGARKGYSGYK